MKKKCYYKLQIYVIYWDVMKIFGKIGRSA